MIAFCFSVSNIFVRFPSPMKKDMRHLREGVHRGLAGCGPRACGVAWELGPRALCRPRCRCTAAAEPSVETEPVGPARPEVVTVSR